MQAFDVLVLREDGDVRLELRGELDPLTAPNLRATAAEVLSEPCDSVVLGCDGLTFLDSSGLTAMVEIKKRCDEVGARMRLVGYDANIGRLLEITGLNCVLTEPGDA